MSSNNQYLPPNNYYDARDDEIDLTELMTHVWATRWRVLFAIVLALTLYAAYIAYGVISADDPVRYGHIFEMNFDGLENGEYPDGSPFVLSSVVGQAVLNRVHERNDLADDDISVGDLRRALSLEPYSADFPLIRQRFEQRLSDEDLSATEIEGLENEMREALSLATAGSIRLTMTAPDESNLDTPMAEAVLKDIPRVWANRAIDEQGVLDLNEAVYSPEIFRAERYMRVDYPVAIDLLQQNVNLLREDIDKLRTRPYADDVSDPETGLRLIDIDKSLSDMLEYDLRRIIDPIRELGLTRDPASAELYLSRQLREVEQDRAFWRERAEMTRNLVGSGEAQRPVQRDGSETGAGDPRMALSAQIDGSFLDRLMEISEQGDSQAFRQSLMREVLEFEEKALTAAQREKRVRRSLEAIRGDAATESVRDDYAAMIEDQLPASLETLRGYTRSIQRISSEVSSRASGNISELVTPVGGSFDVQTASLIPARAPLMATAIAFLAGLVTLFVSLLTDAVRRRRREGMA